MAKAVQHNPEQAALAAPRPKGMTRLAASLLLLAVSLAGLSCSALSNPVAQGIPARRVPPELLGESKEGMERLPLTALRQPPPPAGYKLAAGDVLGVWVEGVLGEKSKPPVVVERKGGQVTATDGSGATSSGGSRETTAIGYPIPVRGNGTITLPLVPPIKVDGMTVEQAEEAVRKAYTVTKEVIKAGGPLSIIVTLQRSRVYHVLVIRQDTAAGPLAQTSAGLGGTGARSVGFLLSLGGGARGARRGTGHVLDLPAYENDVINALALSGGLPGSDAADEIIIERGSFQGEQGRQSLVDSLIACPGSDAHSLVRGTQRIRIPLRYRPGQLALRPEDVVLQSGDIVFIESRESEVFYCAGLLPAGEYPLPRDIDLDALNAVLRIGGPVMISGLGLTNLNGNLMLPGLAFPRPTQLSIVRPTPCGRQVVIMVDLDRALRDPRERILIQPKDLLVLQERPQEAFGRFMYEVVAVPFRYTLWNGPRGFGSIGYNLGYSGPAPAFP